MDETGVTDHAFEERSFYLAEFRGRTLLLALGALDDDGVEAVRAVLDALSANGNRLVLLAPDARLVAGGAGTSVAPDAAPFAPSCWRALRSCPRVLVETPEERLATELAERARALRPWKVIRVDPAGGLELTDGRRPSFVDGARIAEIRPRVVGGRAEILDTVAATLPYAGSINLCSPRGLDAELFTYLGSGTLFTNGRYVSVRDLGIDDLDVAAALLERGVAEGYLAPRGAAERDRILANAIGAFIEERHLAGMCGLEPYPAERAGELVAIYTITRFQGEGIGGHLIARVLERARAQGLEWVFACTTRDPVRRFFLREGFEEMPLDAVPAAKWIGYDPSRRSALSAFRRAVEPGAATPAPDTP